MREDDGDGRDGRGRWKKGFCPNPRGRPRKRPEISDADVHYFMNSGITAKINGEERLMSRAELLIHSMFEQAVKGKNAMLARKLFDTDKAGYELIGSRGKRLLCVALYKARDVDNGEEQISQFLGNIFLIAGSYSLEELPGLLKHLLLSTGGIVPIEAGHSRLLLNLCRSHERGKLSRYTEHGSAPLFLTL